MLTIKDLSSSKELDRDALNHVRGGSNYAYQGDQIVPVIVTKADTITQNDNDTLLNVLSPLANNWSF